MQRPDPLAPLRRAFAIFVIGLVAVLFIGGLRQLLPMQLYAEPTESTADTSSLPPWPFTRPALLPGRVAQTGTQPTVRSTDVATNAASTTNTAPTAVAALPSPSPTVTPAPTATPLPTAAPTSTPPPTTTPENTVDLRPVQPSVHLSGLRHAWQTWNNCGAATLSMNLSYFGSNLDQAAIGNVLRPHEGDKNVDPQQMVDYARSQGYRAELRANGNADLARQLLSNGIPVLIETWLEEEPGDGLGHYRLLVGYEEENRRWIAYDSYVSTNLVSSDAADYQGIYMPYDQTEEWWKVFNYNYVLVYPPEQEAVVQAILGENASSEAMWQASLTRAQNAAAARPDDPFAHFNVGTNLVHYGDYAGAAEAFDRAREIGLPWRMHWYQFGPFEAYFETGRHQEVIDMAQSTLNSAGGQIEELHYWKGRALAAQGNTAAARAEWEQALALDPEFDPALTAMETHLE